MARDRVREHVAAVTDRGEDEAFRIRELRAHGCGQAPAKSAGMRLLEIGEVVFQFEGRQRTAQFVEDACLAALDGLSEAVAHPLL